MLVYANHLKFRGSGAKEAIFKGIGGWLKEQLGFGLHPDRMKQDGEFDGIRGNLHSRLRIRTTTGEEPELYSWVLKLPDNAVHGRQWITEIGVKSLMGELDLSCVVKTDEYSTLVAESVMASQPRLIPYVLNNIRQDGNADLAMSVPGEMVKSVGFDMDSYHSLLVEVERPNREGPIVLVSPTKDGDYLLNTADLQQKLVGLAQVVQVSSNFNSYEMAAVMGTARSAWNGTVNILYAPTSSRPGRARYFLSDDIIKWGDTQHERIAQVLAWVTNSTNISRLRQHIRSEGVTLLAQRRRMQARWAKSEQMDSAQLRLALEETSRQANEQASENEKYFNDLVDENYRLGESVAELQGDLADAQDEIRKKDFNIQSLKDQLANTGFAQRNNVSAEELLELMCRHHSPSPLECVEVIEMLHGDCCTVLPSAKTSAAKMDRFIHGRQLLELLRRLVTSYRTGLMNGGDSEARKVFGKNEYAAKESETLMGNKEMRDQRTFVYDGNPVEMFRHLKIGVDDDTTKTIRVYFHWDAERKMIVIGHCGQHLTISSR